MALVESRTAAIVLAAGASSRYGGFPKACLTAGNETAAHRIVRLSRESGLDPVVVVTGLHDPEIRRALVGQPVRLVHNEQWARGRTGSLQAGLRALDGPQDFLVWPVDHPFVDLSSVARLAATRSQDLFALWFVPMYHGRGGHPILLRREVLPALEALGADAPLRQLITAFGPQVRRVAVDDAGVTANVDDPSSYLQYAEEWRERWTGA